MPTLFVALFKAMLAKLKPVNAKASWFVELWQWWQVQLTFSCTIGSKGGQNTVRGYCYTK